MGAQCFYISLERLKQECDQRGKQVHFRLLELYDIEEAGKELTYEQVAQQFGVKSSRRHQLSCLCSA